ncbi:MAG: FAD-dependent oxidoreductase [Clostridia bacterium]|nr:FAD-dependent oxidoreductase [Clostridia bacterium]
MYDIVIIGAGPAGMTAALYGLRAGKSAVLLECNSFGGQIVYSPRVENFPSLMQISGNELAANMLDQVTALGADVEFAKATSIEDHGSYKKVLCEDGEVFEGKTVIIATGVKHRELGVEGEEALVGSGISYCAVCDGAFFKGKDVAVVGGGDTALQDAIYLSAYCSKVYLIHRRDAFRGEAKLVEKIKAIDNVELVLDSTVSALNTEGGTLNSVTAKNKNTGEERNIPVAGLFVAIGQIPENKPFEAFAELDEYGYFASGENSLTKTPGVFVAGDCRAKEVRQLTTAVGDGAVAGLAACKYIDEQD